MRPLLAAAVIALASGACATHRFGLDENIAFCGTEERGRRNAADAVVIIVDKTKNPNAFTAAEDRLIGDLRAAGYAPAALRDVKYRQPEKGQPVTAATLRLPSHTTVVHAILLEQSSWGSTHELRGIVRVTAPGFRDQWEFEAKARDDDDPPVHTLVEAIGLRAHLPPPSLPALDPPKDPDSWD